MAKTALTIRKRRRPWWIKASNAAHPVRTCRRGDRITGSPHDCSGVISGHSAMPKPRPILPRKPPLVSLWFRRSYVRVQQRDTNVGTGTLVDRCEPVVGHAPAQPHARLPEGGAQSRRQRHQQGDDLRPHDVRAHDACAHVTCIHGFLADASTERGRWARDQSSTLLAAHETSTGVSRSASRLRARRPGRGPPLLPCRRQGRATSTPQSHPAPRRVRARR